MSALVDRIVEVLGQHSRRIDYNHPAYGLCRCGFDPDGWDADENDNPDWTAHVAELVVETLHLEQMLVKEGEVPPLYAIEGWMRGSAERFTS